MSDQKNRRILIVDDNVAIHDDFSKIIGLPRGRDNAIDQAAASLFGETESVVAESPGYELVSAYQGQEALACVEDALRVERPFALAFVDVRMPPGWDGVETVRRIWKIDSELQVVICTAYSDYSWSDMIRALGETDRLLILKKPFDNVEVRQMASALTEKWQLSRDAGQTTEQLQRLVEERTDSLLQANQKLTVEIAERKQLERQLARSQRLEAVGILAGGVAHEFNNLLQAIQGYTRFAMEELPSDDPRYQDLDQALRAAKRAATLTLELVGFSRRQVLNRANVCPNQIVQDVVRLVRSLIGERIEIHVDLARDIGVINVDPDLLQQMLLHLCMNARDAMPGGGKLTINTQNTIVDLAPGKSQTGMKPGNYLTLSVSDTGCGMSRETQEHLFEPFRTTKEIGQGTGLGLAMIHGVMQQHGGIVHVHSELGIGTTIRLHLPMADRASVELESDLFDDAGAAMDCRSMAIAEEDLRNIGDALLPLIRLEAAGEASEEVALCKAP